MGSTAVKRRLPAALVASVYTIVPCVYLTIFRFASDSQINIANSVVIILTGIISGIAVCSLLRSPQQFVVALLERAKLIYALLAVLALVVLAILQYLVARIGRLIIAMIISAVYGISPIDVIPDIFLGLGQLDDIGVFLGSFYWALRAGSIAFVFKTNAKAKEIIANSKISTSFP